MPRDGGYINHADYDQQQGRKAMSDKLYEKIKGEMSTQKAKNEYMEDPMMVDIKKDKHPVREEEE
ncbi:MAG: hypothetical protein GX285_09685 [Clostridiales bacterium]|nr:hypothetical protein [Clostridiales bacterium]